MRKEWMFVGAFLIVSHAHADDLLDTVRGAEKACIEQRHSWTDNVHYSDVTGSSDALKAAMESANQVAACVTVERDRVMAAYKHMAKKSPEGKELVTSFMAYLDAMRDTGPTASLADSPQKAAYDKACVI